jgi:hypothetical protein
MRDKNNLAQPRGDCCGGVAIKALLRHPRHRRDEFGLAVEPDFAEDNLQPRPGGFVGDAQLGGSTAQVFASGDDSKERGFCGSQGEFGGEIAQNVGFP